MEENSTDENIRNRQYSLIKIRLSAAGMVMDIITMSLLAFSGISAFIMSLIATLTENLYIQFLLFCATAGLALSILHFPMDVYGGYILEHRFGLSGQSLPRWFLEKTKGSAVGLAIGIPVALAFFALLLRAGNLWWLYAGLFMIFISIFLARIAPVVIFPLFYRFREIENDELKARLNTFMKEQTIHISGIYSFNMSRDTRKANAGFAGLGKTRRIILSDTLISQFTVNEILTVFAHEVGHYRRRHIIKNLLVGAFLILSSFFICGMTYRWTIEAMGFTELYDIAAMPVLLLYLTLFSIFAMPATNFISRKFELEADAFALRATGDRESFISTMEKLAAMNLSDMDPNPVVEFIFYSHPSIGRRISFARNFK